MSYQPDPPDPAGSGPTWQPAELPADLQPTDPPVYGQPPDEARYGQSPFGQPYARVGGYPPPRAAAYVPPESDRTFLTTWLLAWLVGTLGVDRFYLGKIGTGVLKLVTAGGCGIWALIDLILVLAGQTTDSDGRPLAGYEANRKVAWIVTGVFVVLGLAESVFLEASGRLTAIAGR